ncbi:MAG TPA: AMP-binding protein [Acidimicrobiales bacterium]
MAEAPDHVADNRWQVHLPPGFNPDGLDLTARRCLPAAWAAVWERTPDAAVLFADERWWRAEEIEAASRRVAGRLLAMGLRAGDRMLFNAEASAGLVVAHVAALRAGLVVVPANTAYRQRELSHIVHDCHPVAALVDDTERARWIRAASHDDISVVGPDLDVRGGRAESGTLDTSAPLDPALISYTSGTTGAPKGAVLTHANLLAGTEAVALSWRWSQSDRLVLALPLYHAHGLCVGLHGTLLTGASAVLLARFDADRVLDAVDRHRGTLFFGVPTMYHRLAQSARVGELGGLRLCVSGSAPLPADLHRHLARATRQQVLERYGMTETLMNTSNPYDGERRAGTVGFALPGVDLRLAGGDSGEILVRGPNVFTGYWRQPVATTAAMTDGWFRTGDIGRFDADGYLRILGRSKELIISGGYNVYPREVEDVMRRHPGVEDVAVVGIPSSEWGQVVTAFVVASGRTPSVVELMDFAAAELANYKRPRVIRFVESLPRNALGKVLKGDLAESATITR